MSFFYLGSLSFTTKKH